MFLAILIIIPLVVSFSFSDFFDDIFQGFNAITGRPIGEPCPFTCASGCARGQIMTDDLCLGGKICCRDPNVCGDDYIDGEEICDGDNMSGESCTSQGFFGGTLVCDSCTTLDTSSCSDCGDGTCNATETCAGCIADCNGETADCVGGQVCDMGDCVAEAPPICSDGTSVGSCNVSNKPTFCNGATTLVNNCTYCGCASGYDCDSDTQGCTLIVVTSSGSDYNGRTYTARDASVISSNVGTPALVYDKIRRKDTVTLDIKGETYSFKVKRIYKDDNKQKVELDLVGEDTTLVLSEDEPTYLEVDSFTGSDAKITATDIQSTNLNFEVEELEVVTLTKSSINVEKNAELTEEDITEMIPILLGPEIEPIQANWYEFIVFNVFIFTLMIFFFYKTFITLRK